LPYEWIRVGAGFRPPGANFSSGNATLKETNMSALNLTELNAALRNVGARWEAAQPAEEHLLGYVPGPEDHSFEEREHLSRANYTRFMAMTAAAVAGPPYPPSIDWRHFAAHPPLPAGDYVTPVRDQKSCGSCVAFGTLAAFESAIRIHDKNPAKAVDLSEADLFYCHGEAIPRLSDRLLAFSHLRNSS
jgi:Papain family cysteine protease